jgi:hypothetical protein
MTDHFVVLGVARVRSAWFRDLSRWSTAAALPIEFVKCMSIDEVRARVASGRAFSALMIDGALPALDRDLTDAAHAAGCCVIALDDGRSRRDWMQIGVDAVLPEPAGRDEVLATLREHARPIGSFTADVDLTRAEPEFDGWRGRLVAVVGGGGVGTSTVAMAIAQAVAADVRHAGLVVLADLARRADLALLHDAGDVVPGVQELADAHRTRVLDPEAVRALTFACDDRDYHLLLGLRRVRDWSVLRPHAFEVALDGLLRSFRIAVADVDPDLEGEADCGSIDVEERNLMARTAIGRADVVAVVGLPGVAGIHRQARIIDDLLRFGVVPERVLPVVNRGPRTPRARAEITHAVVGTVAALQGKAVGIASPLYLPDRRRLDDVHRDALPLPRAVVEPIGSAVSAMLERVAPRAPQPEPMLVAPGSLGSWTPETEAGRTLSDP